MRDREELFRGEPLKCVTCHQEGAKWVKEGSGLIRNEDGTYSAYCQDHRPEEFYKQLVLVGTAISFDWRLVEEITLHKPDPNRCDRRGEIITVTMRNIKNTGLAQDASIRVCQALMLAADDRCTIHNWGQRGEQNNCWVEPNYHWETPAKCVIRDKYWGGDQIKNFHKLCRVMAKIHNWKLVDETVDLLDRIVQALDEDEGGPA